MRPATGNTQLLLRRVRDVLARLEETIIFGLIERAQFRQNTVIYEPGALGPSLDGKSLVGYLLHETEKIHARMRRYSSPDEHPFFDDLPDSILPPIKYDESPIKPNDVNLNARIRRVYEQDIVPCICEAGDDNQYGSSSVCDVACLQSLSRRIHYGKFVAESKFRADPGRYASPIAARDARTIHELITDSTVEDEIFTRVRRKAQSYGRPDGEGGPPKIDADVVADIYESCIIPLNKEAQVSYLLQRSPD